MRIFYTLSALLITVITSLQSSFANLKNDILKGIDANTIGKEETSKASGTQLIDKILDFVKDSIFGLLGLISVAMFLYIGFRLVKAQGNPEEMKAAFTTLTYVVVGLFIVAISWAAVKILTGLTF